MNVLLEVVLAMMLFYIFALHPNANTPLSHDTFIYSYR